jgi:hypothetical protein
MKKRLREGVRCKQHAAARSALLPYASSLVALTGDDELFFSSSRLQKLSTGILLKKKCKKMLKKLLKRKGSLLPR